MAAYVASNAGDSILFIFSFSLWVQVSNSQPVNSNKSDRLLLAISSQSDLSLKPPSIG